MAPNDQQPRQATDEDGECFPASPIAEYCNNDVLYFSVLAVFELGIPIDDSQVATLLKTLFLPINPRFSSLLLADEKGQQKWKRVQVRVEDHIKVPQFPTGLEPHDYDGHLSDYLTKIAMERFPESRPLWEFHMFKYPTSEGAGTMIFKLHHALGDGFSLMGALFSCVKRADNPSLPLTLPSSSIKECSRSHGVIKTCTRALASAVSLYWNTACDFTESVMKTTLFGDGRNAIRSGRPRVELEPIFNSSVTISLDQIRQIKHKIGGTVNDVVVGVLFYAIQLYKQRKFEEPNRTRMTALVVLNTRMVKKVQTVEEMLQKKTWGNRFSFLHISIPSCEGNVEKANPLSFVLRAKGSIERKKNSLAVFVNAKFLQLLRSLRGPKVVAKFFHSTLNKTSLAISNLIGPLEKMELGNHPVEGFYFTTTGVPQSLLVSIVSYMGNLRVVMTVEKEFIDSQLLDACMKEAFNTIYKEACGKDGARAS